MDRRTFIRGIAGGLLAAPLAARAQQAGKVYRLGILSPATAAPGDAASGPNGVKSALRELGYVDGQNLVVEQRFAEGDITRLPGLARELTQLRVDVIVGFGAAAVQATRGAKSALPVVFMAGADPIAEGWVGDLARPVGNITGVVIAPETKPVEQRSPLLTRGVPRANRNT